jgi:hypothetical protein
MSYRFLFWVCIACVFVNVASGTICLVDGGDPLWYIVMGTASGMLALFNSWADR